MKEILYIQAGPFANYIGTHFWNTQESYFTYGEGDDPIVDHDRSFREGLTSQGESTYCPRLLLFDRKSNFGALSDGLYTGDDDQDQQYQWGGGVVEHRQDLIAQSSYQTRLARELEDEPSTNNSDHIRFWSDYNRIYLHPRSVHRLPDLADWEATDGDWNTSRATFLRHEAEHDLMENEWRAFVEECDNLQGVQVINDCTTFGGFTDAFLTALRDDLPKMPSLALPLLSTASRVLVNADDQPLAMKAINDALCMRSLESLSTMITPIQDPTTWNVRAKWLDNLALDPHSQYHTSALLATHIETATLPFRLKNSAHDFQSINSLLHPSGTTRTTHLMGMYPIPSSTSWTHEVERRIYDLSAVAETSNAYRATEYARLQVTRGLKTNEVLQYESMFSTKRPSPLSTHAPAYPTPTSFPHFFPSSTDDHVSLSAADQEEARHRALSTLTTTSATSKLFASYARLAQQCVDRRAEVVVRMGLEFDEMKELKDEMWALSDLYAGDQGEDLSEDELGEDEELE
ncbi:tubulin nucleotide-binding domain-like protein [Daedaleopsis nitida]|nr:tubulin nucleotide-binding domain-like protein [Daedaleopsis nitida]